MPHLRILTLCFLLLSFLAAQSAADTIAKQSPRVLFVYDTLDTDIAPFIEEYRRQMNEKGIAFDEARVKESADVDLSPYERIAIYSRVMAFNMASPVRKWIRSVRSFQKKKLFIFTTANRWFEEKHLRQLVDAAKKRDATIVDAVTMATKDLTREQKFAGLEKHLAGLKDAGEQSE